MGQQEADKEKKAEEASWPHSGQPQGWTEWQSGWSLNRMGELFKEGRPSNMLSEVGLTVHCFDGTEDYSAPWKPCLSGHCPQGGNWWSGSIINAKQPHTLS